MNRQSAWHIFSCLGFYPVCPGKPSYQVGLPQFKEVRLELPSGQATILTPKAGQGYAFVKRLKLDGLSVDNLLHSDLVKAKQLRFFCSSCHEKEPRRIS
ncbi:TPA: glycoside hydrolase domain-containing protein [Streptococcus suis]